ncbi:MAG TPA: hypothetical protein VJZ72_05985, partial [Candidatus Limnocylindrales bacterium]|nr:hypothetical protein [Candidatus Limnocylindrales bacterium]
IYRLVTSIHGPDGVAYDAATQALIPALIVHVTGEVWADYRFVEPTATLAGAHLSIPLRLSNTGAAAWESRTFQTIGEEKRIQLGQPARLEVRWLDLASAGRDRDGAALPVARDVPLQVIDPGAETVIRIDVVAPSIPGDYLLVLDVVSPLLGSLAAMGVPPGMVRVHVTEQITLEPQSLRVV